MQNNIATELDIVREYGSIDAFKKYIETNFQETVRGIADSVLKTDGRIMPMVVILTKVKAFLQPTPVAVHHLMESEATKSLMPDLIKGVMGQLAKPNEKFYGVIFYSEVWTSKAPLLNKGNEVEMKHKPSEDPDRQEAVMVVFDFIFGGAVLLYDLLRPVEEEPRLAKEALADMEYSLMNRGTMSALFRKAIGMKIPESDIKVKR